MRHTNTGWKLEQEDDCWGGYGRDGCESSLVPTSFWVNSFNQWDKGSRGITLNGKTKAMHYEMSDEPIVAMKVKPMKYRTCIAGCRGRLYEDKT